MVINEGADSSFDARSPNYQKISGGEKTIVTLEDIDEQRRVSSVAEQINVKVNSSLEESPGRPTIIIEDFNELHSESEN